MLILTITITTLLSVFFGILYAQLDGHIVLLRKERNDARTLPHNSRAALRGVFAFLLGVLASVPFAYHPQYESYVPLMFGLLSFIGIALPFDISYNMVVGNKWDYVASGKGSAIWDKTLVRFFKEDAGVVSIMLKTSILAAIIALVVIQLTFRI